MQWHGVPCRALWPARSALWAQVRKATRLSVVSMLRYACQAGAGHVRTKLSGFRFARGEFLCLDGEDFSQQAFRLVSKSPRHNFCLRLWSILVQGRCRSRAPLQIPQAAQHHQHPPMMKHRAWRTALLVTARSQLFQEMPYLWETRASNAMQRQRERLSASMDCSQRQGCFLQAVLRTFWAERPKDTSASLQRCLTLRSCILSYSILSYSRIWRKAVLLMWTLWVRPCFMYFHHSLASRVGSIRSCRGASLPGCPTPEFSQAISVARQRESSKQADRSMTLCPRCRGKQKIDG